MARLWRWLMGPAGSYQRVAERNLKVAEAVMNQQAALIIWDIGRSFYGNGEGDRAERLSTLIKLIREYQHARAEWLNLTRFD